MPIIRPNTPPNRCQPRKRLCRSWFLALSLICCEASGGSVGRGLEVHNSNMLAGLLSRRVVFSLARAMLHSVRGKWRPRDQLLAASQCAARCRTTLPWKLWELGLNSLMCVKHTKQRIAHQCQSGVDPVDGVRRPQAALDRYHSTPRTSCSGRGKDPGFRGRATAGWEPQSRE